MVEVRGEQLSPRGTRRSRLGGCFDARAVFERALAEQESPHAPFGLAMVLVHRLGREVHHERLEHPAEEEPVGIWLRVVSNTSSTGPRDLDLTLNAPPERAPELCAHRAASQCGVCSGPWTS
jgi:hypothetical protein